MRICLKRAMDKLKGVRSKFLFGGGRSPRVTYNYLAYRSLDLDTSITNITTFVKLRMKFGSVK